MENPLLKRIVKTNKEDIFHSSAYGKAQNLGGMGSTSIESFNTRLRINKNRKNIKGYNHSALANSALTNGQRAKPYVPPTKTAGGK